MLVCWRLLHCQGQVVMIYRLSRCFYVLRLFVVRFMFPCAVILFAMKMI